MAVAAVVAAAARLVVRRVVAVERLVVRVVTVARHARVVQVVAVVAAHLHCCSPHIYGAAVAPERNVLSSYKHGTTTTRHYYWQLLPGPPAQCPEGRAGLPFRESADAGGTADAPITGRLQGGVRSLRWVRAG